MKKQIVTIMLGAVVMLGTATASFAQKGHPTGGYRSMMDSAASGCDVFHIRLLRIADIALIQTAKPPDQRDLWRPCVSCANYIQKSASQDVACGAISEMIVVRI